ncbi:MAG: L,D-transpeptidase family protein [Eubacterium sp.]|nr:L,D-transpeptidase family protein [Eubacterium sp.]
MATGWQYVGKYKYYFKSNGAMLQDLDSVIGRQSSYYITVNRRTCQVMVYAKDGANGYVIPVKTFACSVGLPGTPTPTGTFNTSAKYRWHELMGPSYGQYCTRIVGGVLFHSVAGSNMTSYNLSASEYNKLGSPASHGCVRLCVRDAKWIYDNCALKTTVAISDSAYAPFDKPATIKIPASQNWDPTDPNV